jgi:hypothetical protein
VIIAAAKLAKKKNVSLKKKMKLKTRVDIAIIKVTLSKYLLKSTPGPL